MVLHIEIQSMKEKRQKELINDTQDIPKAREMQRVLSKEQILKRLMEIWYIGGFKTESQVGVGLYGAYLYLRLVRYSTVSKMDVMTVKNVQKTKALLEEMLNNMDLFGQPRSHISA